MNKMNLSRTKKKFIIILGIIIAIFSGLLLVTYLIIHSYINKMVLVDNKDLVAEASEADSQTIDELELEPEDDPSAPDSSETEIRSVETLNRDNVNNAVDSIKSSKEVKNILLIGSDSRTAGGRGRSDSMIIVSINNKKKTITATSIMRDIYLYIPGKGDNRINAAYAFGGANLLINTIEQNFKIKIDNYALVDFVAFQDVVNTIGGITIDLTEKEVPFLKGDLHLIDKVSGEETVIKDRSKDYAGTYHLDGAQALSYARIRYIGNSDFDRTQRQRKVLEILFSNVKGLSFTQITGLLDIVLPQLTTNLSEKDILSMVLSLPKYAGYDIEQYRIPVNGSYKNLRIRGMAVLGIDFPTNINGMYSVIYGEEDAED
jgi:LCP family protein required for cell wall assembly